MNDVRLTRREQEVLDLLAKGLSNAVMATRLGISPHTTRTHVQNILGKLGAHTKLEAVVIASRRGLVEVERPGYVDADYIKPIGITNTPGVGPI